MCVRDVCAGAKNHSVFIQPNSPMHFYAKTFVSHHVHGNRSSVSSPKSTTFRLLLYFFFSKCAYTYRSIHFNALRCVCVCVYRTMAIAYVSRILKARNVLLVVTARRIRSIICFLCLCDKYPYDRDQSTIADQMRYSQIILDM